MHAYVGGVTGGEFEISPSRRTLNTTERRLHASVILVSGGGGGG